MLIACTKGEARRTTSATLERLQGFLKQKWDTEFMSSVKGAPWDFKANAGDDVNDGGTPERVDAPSPDPSIELPSPINVRRKYSRSLDVEKYGPDERVSRRSEGHEVNCALDAFWLPHTGGYRERMARLTTQDHRRSGPRRQSKNTSR